MITEGTKFRHFLSKKEVHYIITDIRRAKILDVNSGYIATIIDCEGENMGEKWIDDIEKFILNKEWIILE